MAYSQDLFRLLGLSGEDLPNPSVYDAPMSAAADVSLGGSPVTPSMPGGFTGVPTPSGFEPSANDWMQPFQYQPMAGWEQRKLQNGPNNTKYNFGRFVQQQGFDPKAARNNLGPIVEAYNQAFGGKARAIGHDKIDFGEFYGPVDVLNSGGYWQWGAWNDPTAGSSTPQAQTLASLTGPTPDAKGTVAPTWNAMLQNGSAYGASPLQPQERTKQDGFASLAQLMGGWK